MNIENLKKVRQAVIDSPAFDMTSFFSIERENGKITYESTVSSAVMHRTVNPCGTTACIAGECAILIQKEYEDTGEGRDLSEQPDFYTDDIAREYLGLTVKQADWLFYGGFSKNSLCEITKEQAVEAIEYMIEHGSTITYDEDLVIN